MVSLVNGDCGSEAVHKRRRTTGEALTPAQQQRQTARYRKQTLMSRLSDSGFEEDLGSSPVSCPALRDVSQEPPAGQQLSSWYLQYGDIGFRIQREKEALFHSCRSLARQPQVRHFRSGVTLKWSQILNGIRCQFLTINVPTFHTNYETTCNPKTIFCHVT